MINYIKAHFHYKNVTSLVLTFVVAFLMVSTYFNSFIPRYDVGRNLDDKMVILLSSQYSFNSIHSNIDLFDIIVDKCNLESKNVELCLERYKFRINGLSNYVLSGSLINIFIDYQSDDLDVELSQAIFYGLSLLVFFVFVFILMTMLVLDYKAKLFVLISFCVLIVTNPYFFHVDLSKISSLFFMSKGDGYLPMIYVPRGAVSYLLIPITLAIVYNKNPLLIFSLVLASLIHLAYGLVFSILTLAVLTANIVLDKSNNRIVYFVAFWVVFLLFIISFQTIYAESSVSSDIFSNGLDLLAINVDSNVILRTIVILCFIVLPVIYMDFSLELKKYSIVFFIMTLSVYAITTLEISEIIAQGRVSERIFGSFAYIYVSILFYLFVMIGIEIRLFSIRNKIISVLCLVIFVVWTYAKTEIDNSIVKLKKVEQDVQLMINENYGNDDNLYWLSRNNNQYKLDVDKINQLRMVDIDVDNEFLVFVKLYLMERINN